MNVISGLVFCLQKGVCVCVKDIDEKSDIINDDGDDDEIDDDDRHRKIFRTKLIYIKFTMNKNKHEKKSADNGDDLQSDHSDDRKLVNESMMIWSVSNLIV